MARRGRRVVGVRGACSENSDPRIRFPSHASAHPGEAVGFAIASRHPASTELMASRPLMTPKTSTVTDSVDISVPAVWLRHGVQLAGVGDPRNLDSQLILGPLPTKLNLLRSPPSLLVLIVELFDIHAHPAASVSCHFRLRYPRRCSPLSTTALANTFAAWPSVLHLQRPGAERAEVLFGRGPAETDRRRCTR